MSTPAGTRAAEPPHALSEYESLPEADLHARIAAAKQRLGSRLVVLGHHYQRDEVIRYADFIGDSYQPRRARPPRPPPTSSSSAACTSWPRSADVLAQPHQRVILPDLGAGCSMADMADVDDVEEAWEAIGETYGDEAIPITYMNSTAAIKAFCGRHGGLVCTSSNAQAAFRWAWERKRACSSCPTSTSAATPARRWACRSSAWRCGTRASRRSARARSWSPTRRSCCGRATARCTSASPSRRSTGCAGRSPACA